jgi:Flp pilus assembly protein TadG
MMTRDGSSKFRQRLVDWRAGIARDQGGAAAVEFAIIAPVFFFLMFVIAETALVFIAEQVMDNAVFETARLIRTGQVDNADMSEADFKDEVCDRMSVFVDCSGDDFYLEVKSFGEGDAFDDLAAAADAEPVDDDGEFEDPDAFDFGDANDIVLMRAYYQWPTRTIFWGQQLSSPGLSGKYLIGSFAAFKNEPYTATASN